jgi:hypothetical protein
MLRFADLVMDEDADEVPHAAGVGAGALDGGPPLSNR